MHHSLAALPRQVVLDANILMDASFVSDGVARRALNLLEDLGFSPIADEATIQEATRKLRHLRGRFFLQYDPVEVLNTFIASSRILQVPPAPILRLPRNQADAHIIAAAKHYNAWLLTGDAPLVCQCNKLNVVARFPWDVIMEHAEKGEGLKASHILRLRRPARESGSIFARVIPGEWAGMQNVGDFTVCEVENIGRVFYSSVDGAWHFQMRDGPRVTVPGKIVDKSTWAVAAMYKAPQTGQGCNAALRIGGVGRNPETRTVQIGGPISAQSPGTAAFGHSVAGHDHWNGYLRCAVLSHNTINAKTWQCIASLPEAAPNPFDNDALARALKSIQRTLDGGQIRFFATEADLQL